MLASEPERHPNDTDHSDPTLCGDCLDDARSIVAPGWGTSYEALQVCWLHWSKCPPIATLKVNGFPKCRRHAEKRLRELIATAENARKEAEDAARELEALLSAEPTP